MKSFGQDTSGDAGKARPYIKFAMDASGAETPTPPAHSAVGTLLCATRMRLGKDLQRSAEVLHIRYNYLVAIEDGRYEDLPGHAYAIGFVRAYADHLGLDGDEVVRRFKEDSVGIGRKAVFEFPLPAPDSGIPSGALILAAIVLGMLVYGVWYSLAGSDRSALHVIQEVPDRLAALLKPPGSGEVPVAAPETDSAAPVVKSADAEGDDAPAGGAGEPASEAAASSPPLDAKPAVAEASDTADVVDLHAKADVWVTLRDGEKADQTQFLHKDEIFRVPQNRAITLITGKARDLEILVNGKAVPPLDEGLFARGVVLDPQRLKSAP